MPTIPTEYRAAYREFDRDLTIRKTRLGCLIGIIFVPLFSGLDYCVFPAPVFKSFLIVRLLCSFLMACLYPVIGSAFGRKYYRFQGVAILSLPSASIAWMIYDTDGASSPYYAGLILVQMVLAVVLDWTFWQSVTSVVLVWLLYLTACFLSPVAADLGILINNSFFLVSTGITIIIGAKFHSDIRQREFVARCELDKSQRELAAQNTALEKANRDIKEAEMQLVQAEKMSSLGRFSAGLMHDILNPLNFVGTALFVLRKKHRHLPPAMQAESETVVADIEAGLKRVNNIVSDLRTFTHPGEQAMEAVDLAEILNVSLRFVSGELTDHNIVLELDLSPGQTAWCGRNQFTSVLVNLLENSIDALSAKKFTDGDQPTLRITSRAANGRSLILIRDNGVGIDPKNMPKIFDPFFTTKDVGQGTGLGLSTSFGIIRGYGGTISASSEPGKFCELTLDLPADDPKLINHAN
jgi:two-component system sensor histidine kinase PhcS